MSQNIPPLTKTNKTFIFTAGQLIKLVANVVIQIAQPQVCFPNSKQDTLARSEIQHVPTNFQCRQNNTKC